MNNYSRWQEKIINKALKTRRVIILSGARQTGKTTISKSLISKDVIYRTLDNLNYKESAENDPRGFIEHDAKMMIIDEIQHAPELILAIKEVVDKDNRFGQYLLTGSSNIQSMPSVRESLAGRVRKIRLRALSQGEIENSQPSFLKKAFKQKFTNKKYSCSQQDIVNRAFKGGYPEAIKLSSQKQTKQWHKDYISSLLDRDLKDILNLKRQDSMKKLVSILSAWSSKFMDISAISSGLSIQRQTIENYMNALEMLYLFERVPAWSKTDYAGVGKRSKLFITDSGLMTSILNWNNEKIRFESDRLGKLVETFIFQELASHIDANELDYELYHYRDSKKREIDFLVERDDGALLGIEVKSGSVCNKDSFKHLKFFKENIAKDRNFIGIVLYAGEDLLPFGTNFLAVPISALWE